MNMEGPRQVESAQAREAATTDRRRRARTTFNSEQVRRMETVFALTHYPDLKTRENLSNAIGIPENRVQIWFQNRRAKWRKYEKLSSFGGLQFLEPIGDNVPAPKSSVPRQQDKNSSFLSEEDSLLNLHALAALYQNHYPYFEQRLRLANYYHSAYQATSTNEKV